MKEKETWMWREAKWWQIWLPQSGIAGGVIWGLIITLLFGILTGHVHAACNSQKIDGINVITCDEYRVVERQVYRPDPNNVTYRWNPSLYGGGGGVVESPRQVQPQSNEELTRELNERYKNYGGYKQGQTLNKNAGNRGGYSWHK